MWYEGNQTVPKKELAEVELARQMAIEGFLEEDVAKIELYKFFRNNISIATKILMGVDLFPYQHIMVKTNLSRDYVLNIVSRGAGKSFLAGIFAGMYALLNPGVKIGILAPTFRQCLEENEYVTTDQGLRQIKDVEVGQEVLSEETKNPILNKWKNDPKKGLKLTTKRGFSVKGLEEHRIMVYDENLAQTSYKDLKDIKVGDRVVISPNGLFNKGFDPCEAFLHSERSVNYKQRQLILKNEPDLYYFIGLLLGDGCINMERGRFFIRTTDKETTDFILGFIESSLREKVALQDGGVSFDSVEFRDFCEFIGVKSGRLVFPEQILKCDKEHIWAVLVGLFNKTRLENIDFHTASPQMGRLVQLLLLQYGIVSTYSSEKAKLIINEAIYLKPFRKDGWFKVREAEVKKAILYDTVTEVREIGDIVTYDIEVANEHCYCGQGFINHNSKRIYQYIEEIAAKKKAVLFHNCITGMRKSNDEWRMDIGESQIYSLPLGTGEKLRGFRFNCILIDELLLMPSKIINEVIVPFLGVVRNPDERNRVREAEDYLISQGKMQESERYVWPNNKLIGLSSASYAFEYLYELYQVYESLIMNPDGKDSTKKALIEQFKKGGGNATRAIVHMGYQAIPPDIYDKSLLEQAMEQMSESQFAREFKSVFTDDSSGYFRISKMKDCTIEDGSEPSVELKGDPAGEYILAIDPSWAENDASDDFAIQVLKLDKERRISTIVHSYAVAGAKVKQHISYLLYLLKNFNVVMIWADYSGGSQFIDSCNESAIFKNEGIKLGVLKEEFEFDEKYNERLMAGKSEYNKSNRNFVVFRKFSTDWIRQGNELLQANFDHKRLWFAAKCFNATFEKQTAHNIQEIDEIQFLGPVEEYKEQGQAKMVDFLERQHECLDLTKAECALIQVRTSPQGTQVFDLPENIKRSTGPNRTRRDSYTALVIGSWGAKVYFDMMEAKAQAYVSDFTPLFVC